MVAPVDTALLVCIFMLQLLTAVKVLVVLAQYALKIWSARTKLTGGRALCTWIGQLVWPVTNRKVIEKFHSLQCQLLIKALQVTMVMACIRFAFAQTYLLAGERPPVHSLDLALVAVHFIGLILTQFPALARPRCLDLWYILLQGLLVAPFFVVGRRHVITLSNWTFVLRVMLGLSARHGCFVVLGNAVASVLVMRLVGFNSQSALFTGEVTKLSFLLLAVFSIRQLIFRDAKASVELKSRSIELDAVSSLLRGFCDAVVEVDQSLRITENSHQLLTILLRSSNQACLAGKDFVELFCIDDQPRVHECLTNVSDTHTHAVNSRLLDTDGNYVKVELLHIRFVTAGGDLHRLVGIREYQDMQDVAVKALPPAHSPQGVPQGVLYDTETTTDEEPLPGTPTLMFDIGSFAILEANQALRKLTLKCIGAHVKMSKVNLWDLSPDLSFRRLSGPIQDLVNSQACSSIENVSAEMDLGEMVLLRNMQVLAKVSVQWDPVFEKPVGTLFLYPTGIPALTKANVDRLENGRGKRRKRRHGTGSHRSRSSRSSSGASSTSGNILDLHRTIPL